MKTGRTTVPHRTTRDVAPPEGNLWSPSLKDLWTYLAEGSGGFPDHWVFVRSSPLTGVTVAPQALASRYRELFQMVGWPWLDTSIMPALVVLRMPVWLERARHY